MKRKLELRKGFEQRYYGWSAGAAKGSSPIDLRPGRFYLLDDVPGEKPRQILVALVNATTEKQLKKFLGFDSSKEESSSPTYGNIITGGTRQVDALDFEEHARVRDLLRKFWTFDDDKSKASLFVQLAGPWPNVYSPKFQTQPHFREMCDFTKTALEMNWKTGRFVFNPRGVIDRLCFTAWENRKRLRICKRRTEFESSADQSICGKLFIAGTSRDAYCSTECTHAERNRSKLEYWNRRAARRKKSVKKAGR